MTIRVFDLSQRIENGMPTFGGDPEPRLQAADWAAPWKVTEIQLGSHTGTHLDAPAHLIPDGKTIDQIAVGRFLVTAVATPLLNIGDDGAIEVEALADALGRLPDGGGILLQTNWSQHWDTERYFRHPYLSAGAARAIVDAGAGMVGIDAPNVDSTVQASNHAHQALLGNGCLIVENLAGLAQLEPLRLYRFSFLPLPLTGADGSPVRAVAWEM